MKVRTLLPLAISLLALAGCEPAEGPQPEDPLPLVQVYVAKADFTDVENTARTTRIYRWDGYEELYADLGTEDRVDDVEVAYYDGIFTFAAAGATYVNELYRDPGRTEADLPFASVTTKYWYIPAVLWFGTSEKAYLVRKGSEIGWKYSFNQSSWSYSPFAGYSPPGASYVE